MSRRKADLVSVVIPALNAKDTLDETLASVRAQTYRELEIIVVDDGSTDPTLAVARRHAAQDRRVIILAAQHGGLANARNTGIAMSRGDLIAPVDADDLWHPMKTARQIDLMRERGPRTGFAYTLFRRIDERGLVQWSQRHAPVEGRALNALLFRNFVGNGSSLMIRREVVQEVGGYEVGLYREGAQGCEDLLLQLLIARKWLVGCVPEYLTGYRRRAEAMSRDWVRMARSRILALDYLARQEDEPRVPVRDLRAAAAAVHVSLSLRFMTSKQPRAAAEEALRAFRLAPAAAARAVARGVVARMPAGSGAGSGEQKAFYEMDPRDPGRSRRGDSKPSAQRLRPRRGWYGTSAFSGRRQRRGLDGGPPAGGAA